MAKRHYTIYCDESAKKGRYYSNFYGGALVRAEDRQSIEDLLYAKKDELNISGEMKWTKITKNYSEKYIEFIRLYFEFVKSGRIKIRIMFTHNYKRAKNLTDEQRKKQYFLLYYQMLKHSFGLAYSNPNLLDRIYITTLLDQIPDTNEKVEEFKEYISKIGNTAQFRGKGVFFIHDQIADVDSKKHSIMQGLDIILGSVNFRLNDHHKDRPPGSRTRSKRTIAKEKVYKEINRQIRVIYPNFNVGVSTGTTTESDRWKHRYRHWCFLPAEFEIDNDAVKPR